MHHIKSYHMLLHLYTILNIHELPLENITYEFPPIKLEFYKAMHSVARFGGFPPNWAVLILQVNIGWGSWTKFGLVWGQFSNI